MMTLTHFGLVAGVCALAAVIPSAMAAEFALGAGDQVLVRALHAPEISDRTQRIDENGFLQMGWLGNVKAAGLTPEQLAKNLEERLRQYVREPKVTVEVTELRSHPVSVLGAVKNAGLFQITGKKTLVEVLSLAGGLTEDAGYTMTLTRPSERGPIPVEESRADRAGFSVAEFNLPELLEGRNPALNIEVMPDDVVAVPRAKLVYVVGEVRKAGGFVLRDRESMTALQALSMAEGVTQTAALKSARILRRGERPDERTEIEVNLKDILAGKIRDTAMLPDDVLYVPNSTAKTVMYRGADAAVQLATGLVIWRR